MFYCFKPFCLSGFFFFKRGFLCVVPGCSGIGSVDQSGLKLRDQPVSATHVLGLKTCTTIPGLILTILFQAQRTTAELLKVHNYIESELSQSKLLYKKLSISLS